MGLFGEYFFSTWHKEAIDDRSRLFCDSWQIFEESDEKINHKTFNKQTHKNVEHIEWPYKNTLTSLGDIKETLRLFISKKKIISKILLHF